MEHIQTSLQRFIKENKRFKERLQAMKREIFANERIIQFLHENPDITDATVEKRLNRLYEYVTQSIQCEKCDQFSSCKNLLPGYTPKLENVNGDIHLSYEKCPNRLRYEQIVKKRRLIKSLYMPREIFEAKMADLYIDAGRAEAIKEIDSFLEEAKNGLPERGIYFSGPFGVGKTYFLGAIANELQQLNISSTIIYMPELVREIHASIEDNTVQEKIELFKTTEVLMLDDIGAENLSAWFRDEVLGAILQYRMMEKLPVFFTSNYSMDQLEEVLATTTRGDVEKVKAGRIMERIRQVSKEVKVGGENRRNH